MNNSVTSTVARDKDKGVPTCVTQVNEFLGGMRSAENVWSSSRYNATYSWYVNLGNGNMNNNNVYNRYVAAAVSELSLSEKKCLKELIEAEKACFKNKHSNPVACLYHYSPYDLTRLMNEIMNKTWKPGPSIVFGITYPTLREVWAASYPDRIIHHYVAPILIQATEKIHNRNGDVSHGNRTGHSSYTAARQILEVGMKTYPGGFVGKVDVSGFFMSINRKSAWEIVKKEISDSSKNWLLERLILHDPTSLCTRHSPQSLLDKIPKRKSLFHTPPGFGLPIGNFYSQLVANAYLGSIDSLSQSEEWKEKIKYTRFVDDICICGPDSKTVLQFMSVIKSGLQELGLNINSKKKYIQPIKNGVEFCGYYIKPGRIYISNRTRNNCLYLINHTDPNNLKDVKKLVGSLNSYFGFFSKVNGWNIQTEIGKLIFSNFGKTTTQSCKHNQIVFKYSDLYVKNSNT